MLNLAFVVPPLMFIIFAEMVQKYDEGTGILRTMVIYVVGGFGYIDDLINSDINLHL